MNDGRDRGDATRRRFRPLRAITPWVCAAVGIVAMVRGAVGLGANGDPLFLLLGLALVVTGIVTYVVSGRRATRGR